MLGHVSFPKELRERRLCLFVNTEKLKDLSNKTSPAVVKVKLSCIHKVSWTPWKAESFPITPFWYGSTMLVIWFVRSIASGNMWPFHTLIFFVFHLNKNIKASIDL